MKVMTRILTFASGCLLAAAVFLFTFLTVQLCGCSDNSSSKECPEVGGFYKITSGNEIIIDNWGQELDVEFTADDPGEIGITQDGCVATVISCLWDLREDGQCNTSIYGVDNMFGPAIGNTTGKLTRADDGSINVDLEYSMEYPLLGYSVFAGMEFVATPDPELLDKISDTSGGGS